MTAYTIVVDERADRRLHAIASELGRTVEDLISTSAEEAALNFFRSRADDPARPRR